MFWNYKKSFSIILLALVDSKYKFVIVDVGAAGSEGNSNTFRNSAFGLDFMEDRIPLLTPRDLPCSNIKAPYVLIGDEAFPSGVHLLKPYSKKSKCATEKTHAVFNYRLS